MPAVALYGPPASGKDTVTAQLLAVDSRYVAFRRLKVGGGRTSGYRVVTAEQFSHLEASGEILYRNDRYGNVYGIDSPALLEATGADRVPVLHLGQVAAITAVEAFPADWIRVLLWCPRRVAAQRSVARGDNDTSSRLAAWDETYRDLANHLEVGFDVVIRTDQTLPAEAAHAIHASVRGLRHTRRSPRIAEVTA